MVIFGANGSSIVRIRNVLWWRNVYRGGVAVSFDGWSGGAHTLTNNVFYDNTDPGMGRSHPATLLAIQLVDFRNNIVYGNHTSETTDIDAATRSSTATTASTATPTSPPTPPSPTRPAATSRSTPATPPPST